MITDSEVESLRANASEILWRKHQMKLFSTNKIYVSQCKNLSEDLTKELCDKIERLYFKIQHRREKNET